MFHVESHPLVPEFTQCVSLNSFSTNTGEKAYVLFGILSMYVVPLIIILSVSIVLLCTLRVSTKHHLQQNISHGSIEPNNKILLELPVVSKCRDSVTSKEMITEALALKLPRTRLCTGLQLHHSNTVIREQARLRTLNLSLLIVTAFILCYTP